MRSGSASSTQEDVTLTPADSVATNPFENDQDLQNIALPSISHLAGEYESKNLNQEYWTDGTNLVNTGDPLIDTGVV